MTPRSIPRALGLLSLALFTCTALSACGSDEGQKDGLVSAGDGGPPDGGSQLPADDASQTSPDDDGGRVTSGDTVLCSFDADDVHAWSGNAQLSDLSMATDERGFALLHHDPDGALMIEALPLGEDAQPSVRLISAIATPGHAELAVAQERFAMLWQSGETLSFKLLEGDAAAIVVSEQVAESESGEPLFAFVGQGDRFVAVFAEPDGDGQSVLWQSFDLEGEALDDATRIDIEDVPELTALKLAALEDGGVLLAWSTPSTAGTSDERFEVMGVMLDAGFEPQGDPETLSKVPAASARFDLDARIGSAGLLYPTLEGGTRQTAKLQRVETDAPVPASAQPALNLVNAPRRIIDTSITAFGQGYAAAYRALPSLGVSDPVIRIAFIDATGLIVHEAELADTTETAGATSVRSTAHGELLVSWTTASPSTVETHALALDCPGALVLCGGERE